MTAPHAGRAPGEPAFWSFSGAPNPYPAYAAQRAEDPLCPVPDEGMYVVTRHSDVRSLLRDPRCSASRLAPAEELGGGRGDLGRPLRLTLARMAAFSDPPRHERVRRPLQQAFAPQVVAPLRRDFAALAREHVGAVAGRRDPDGSVEIAGALVDPLMNAAIARMLRLPADAPAAIRDLWARAGISADGLGSGVTEDSPRLLAGIHAYLGALLERARSEPADDPLGTLVAAADSDPELTDAELVANLIFVVNSAHRALAQAFGLFVHTLATHPDEYAALRADPGLVRGAVEALLRHDTSVQFTSRRLTEDVELDGRTLRAGSLVVLMLGAANRDPEVFADPDRVDVEDAQAGHVSFGYGAHFCAGAAVSRMLLHEALVAVCDAAPRLKLCEAPEWTRFRLNMRGCERLRVLW